MVVGSQVGGRDDRSQVRFPHEVVDMSVASGQQEKTEREADGGSEKRICVKAPRQDSIDDGKRTPARDER